jgi:chromosome segregation protein
MVQFTKLKLSGFKSFLHPTEIDISDGLTGVVGPNGCGKSNLLEALGWVMGETSAKKLRGGAMDDVIFNGTHKKAARNNAEVTVCLDNSDRTAPPPYNTEDTLEVTRRIERATGSDYFINGKTVRAKDVQLLFADLVTGANSPALVSQGRITSIIQSKPTDRRRILEDAAGISGLHVRRHEAELKLRGTEKNLERLDDVTGAMETQLSGLKKQARQATRYKNISHQMQNLEGLAALLKWQSIQDDIKQKKELFETLEQAVRDHLKITTSLSTQQAEKTALMPDLRKKEAESAAILQRLRIEKDNLETEQRQLEDKKSTLQTQLSQIESDQNHENEQVTTHQEKIHVIEKEIQEIQNLKSVSLDNISKQELSVSDLTQQNNEAQQSYQVLIEELASLSAQSNSLRTYQTGLEGNLAKLMNEQSDHHKRLDDLKEKQQQSSLFDSLQNSLKTLEHDTEQLKQKLITTEEQKSRAEQKRLTASDDLQEEKDSFSRLEAEILALKSVLTLETGDESFESVLQNSDPQKGYETAFASALGDSLNISDDINAPLYWSSRGEQADPLPLPDNLETLDQFVKAPAFLKKRLSQIGVAETPEQAEKLAKNLTSGQTIVTKDGSVWHGNGITITRDAPNKAASLLKQKTRLKTLERQITSQSDAIQHKEQIKETIEKDIENIAKALVEERTAIQDVENQIKQKRAELGSMQDDIQEQKSEKKSLESSLERIQAQITETKNDITINSQKIATLKDDTDLTHKKDKQAEIALSIRTKLDQEQAKLTSMQHEEQTRHTRSKQLETDLNQIKSAYDRSIKRLEELALRKESVSREYQSINTSPQALTEKQEALSEKIETARITHETIHETLQQEENQLREIDSQLRKENNNLSDQREERARVQATLQSAMEKGNEIEQTIFDQFECKPYQLSETLEYNTTDDKVLSLEKITHDLQRLHTERDRMGPVNLRAETESQELIKEIETLTQEKEELVVAISKLRQAINKLNREARERFLNAFETINTYFKDIFSRLFHGGNAHLELTDTDDPLNSGLEIFAQPPGKKLQNLNLLSGGEQTLASIALVFSMFLTNPSPICILDEIDAALDDANVDRVCNMLDEMAQQGKTRFLVISHHKMTVARMDRLYGVTMADRGISQLVSVDLSQPDLLSHQTKVA